MRLLIKLRRSLQKKYFPTERDKVMRRWKADQGDQVLRLNYHLRPDSVVMDLGGYRGDWAHEIHSRYRCRVHVFEPVLSFADGIAQRFAGNSAIQVQFHDVAADSRSRMAHILRRMHESHSPTYQYPFVWENWQHKAA